MIVIEPNEDGFHALVIGSNDAVSFITDSYKNAYAAVRAAQNWVKGQKAMSTPNGERFAQEMLAVADSLRHVREQIRFLVDADDPLVSVVPDVWVSLSHGLPVANALTALAGRFGEPRTALDAGRKGK